MGDGYTSPNDADHGFRCRFAGTIISRVHHFYFYRLHYVWDPDWKGSAGHSQKSSDSSHRNMGAHQYRRVHALGNCFCYRFTTEAKTFSKHELEPIGLIRCITKTPKKIGVALKKPNEDTAQILVLSHPQALTAEPSGRLSWFFRNDLFYWIGVLSNNSFCHFR